jgi:SAM-dependent methyltransferase
LEVVPPGSGAVLDLGGGRGSLREPITRLGYSYINLDIQRFQDKAPSLVADAHVLPIRDSTFQLVISKDTLEHFLEPWRVVKEVHRVLQDGGKFIIWVPFLHPFHGNDIYRYTPKGLRHLLSDYEIILFDSPLWVFSIFGIAGVEFLKRIHLGFAKCLIERLTGFLDYHFMRRRKQPASFAAAYRIVACKPTDEDE